MIIRHRQLVIITLRQLNYDHHPYKVILCVNLFVHMHTRIYRGNIWYCEVVIMQLLTASHNSIVDTKSSTSYRCLYTPITFPADTLWQLKCYHLSSRRQTSLLTSYSGACPNNISVLLCTFTIDYFLTIKPQV